MSGNGNQVPLAPSQRGPGSYPRASTPHRPECYLPPGGTGAAYMPGAAGGGQPPAQPSMRVQPTPQPSAPPAPSQDLPKSMSGHNYVSPQNQSSATRPQFSNQFSQFRGNQHGARPNPRQQQPFIPGATAAATGPVMYIPHVFPPPMGIPPSYQQQRSNTPGFYQYVTPFISYTTPPNHTSPYYSSDYFPPNSQPLQPTTNIQGASAGNRSNPTTLVGPQTTTPSAPTATIPHSQPPAHMPQAIPGIRPTVKRSNRIPIIDPATNQEIVSDDNVKSGVNSERQTPQPDTTPTHSSIVEEFSRMVNEAASQPSPAADSANKMNSEIYGASVITSSATTSSPPQNAISSVNSNVIKSDLLIVNNENKGPDIAAEANETPVVSAISDSPVIVPKMPMNLKQLQKISEQNQSLVIEENKIIPPNKQHKNKPVVPQSKEIENSDIFSIHSSNIANVVLSQAPVVPAVVTSSAALSALLPSFAPQPQRIREPRERLKSEEKAKEPEREANSSVKLNGPTPSVGISSVDSLQDVINPPTSQSSLIIGAELTKKQLITEKNLTSQEADTLLNHISKINSKVEPLPASEPVPSATELLSASIEKVAKEVPAVPEVVADINEPSSAIQAQVKLTQSIASCIRSGNQAEPKMKDITLNNNATDPDAANGNTGEIGEIDAVKEDINRNEKLVKNAKNASKKQTSNKILTNDLSANESESQENGKVETDKDSNVEEEEKPIAVDNNEESNEAPEEKPEAPVEIPAPVPKYKYAEGQWSPFNKAGKKFYDIGLLKQIKEDPQSKNKPDAPLLETCNIIRTTPMQEPVSFTNISRPMNDALFPNFFQKTSGVGPRNNSASIKKDGRNMIPTGKGSGKLTPTPSGSGHKPVIQISLSLREEVKLSKTEFAWKPSRYKKDNMAEEELKTQELYSKFRGILNKLTPQKFDTLLEKVKALEINNQKRLEGIIDLIFEKAIDEPNFSEAYATMCNKLCKLRVPADNPTTPDQYVNFRALIICKCQKQFVEEQVDESILKLQNEINECQDPAKKKELQMQLEEESRRLRMRSVGNVRFIGELYKLKMLTSKIMVFCMNHLIEKLEEEKLECLCKLLTTIGEQVESEVKKDLDRVFKKMQEIVDRKSNKISSRIRFMIKDVIDLRSQKWVTKSVVDMQPKMMDQIQKESEQQQRHIELMNSAPMGGGFRRDDGGRGKRGGDSRRQNNNSFMDNNWKTPRTNYPVDTSKLKAVTQKNLTNIKLAPQNSAWSHGSGTKNTAQAASNSMLSLTKSNKYSVLATVQADPTVLRGSKDLSPSYHSKGASIERSTFIARGDFSNDNGSRSGSMGVPRSNSGSRSTSATPQTPPAVPEAAPLVAVPQEPLPEAKKKTVKSTIDLHLINPDDNEFASEIKLFPPQYQAAIVSEILNSTLEKSSNIFDLVAKALFHLISTNTILPENFLAGFREITDIAPDLYIDIPMLYTYLAKIISPLIEKKYITFVQTLRICETIVSLNHGHILLKAVINHMKESMGPSFVKSKWQESGLQLKFWMNEDQVPKWIEENKFEFLDGGAKVCETKKKITPAEAQSKLLQLMNLDESCDCLKGWVQDNLGETSSEDWFMRALIQAICEHALFGAEGREVPHFNQDRMNKYSALITEFGESQQSREASCLFGIQQLIHRLEHPQGLTLEIFQCLREQYIIKDESFIAWEESEKEPEGKAVMLKALTSFFTNIKEADNEESCSED